MRTLASLTGYFYAVRNDAVYVNFYADSEGTVEVGGTSVKLTQTTHYPWDGAVRIAVAAPQPAKFTLRVRIPEWARGRPVPSDLYSYVGSGGDTTFVVRVGGVEVKPVLVNGYVGITREWKSGDDVQVELPMPVRRVRGNEHIEADRGRVAFERGPVVYCVEDVDRAWSLDSLSVPADAAVTAEMRPKLLGGVEALVIKGARGAGNAVGPVTAIPYFAWDNRGLAPMAVWLQTGRAVTTMAGAGR
jgi:DUF1680 family protein